jgi:hypothetical protein
MFITNVSKLGIGAKFIISEPANITVASGFIVKLPVDNKTVFTVIKVNEKTVITSCESIPAKFVSNKGTVDFKFEGTEHWRSLGKDILVTLV